MGVKLQSALGGSVELNAPSTASNFTMTVPAGNGTVATTDQLAGFRNRVINGDMRIDQRHNGQVISNSGVTIDRWLNSRAGSGTYSAQRSSVAPATFTNSLVQTVTAAVTPAASDTYQLFTALEGTTMYDAGWGTSNAQPITVSFWVRSSIAGTYGFSIHHPTQIRVYVDTYTISAADTWEYKTVTIPGDTGGTWATDINAWGLIIFDQGSGSNQNTTTPRTWQTTSARRTSACVNWISTAGATFYLTGVQLEIGTVATPFERLPYSLQFQMCQRYFQRIGNSSYVGIGVGRQQSTTIAMIYAKPNVPMRTTPSASIVDLIVTERTSFDANVTGIVSFVASSDSIYMSVTHVENGTPSSPVFLTPRNGTSGYLQLSAEL